MHTTNVADAAFRSSRAMVSSTKSWNPWIVKLHVQRGPRPMFPISAVNQAIVDGDWPKWACR